MSSPIDYPTSAASDAPSDDLNSPINYSSSSAPASSQRDQPSGSAGPASGDAAAQRVPSSHRDASSDRGVGLSQYSQLASSPLSQSQHGARQQRRRDLPRGDVVNRMRRVPQAADRNGDGDHMMVQLPPRDEDGDMKMDEPASDVSEDLADQATIWGTNIVVNQCQRRIRNFLDTYCDPGVEYPKYPRLLQDIIHEQNTNLNLDMQNVYAFNRELYQRIVDYPQDMIPMIDFIVDTLFRDKHPVEHAGALAQIEVKTFNLQTKKKMREVDPDDIDRLVSFDAMVVRASPIIPDLSRAFFRCVRCKTETTALIDRGRINEPGQCPSDHCRGRGTMDLIHNRCDFIDKQLVRIQETPDNMPEGETPQTIDAFTFKDLVDVAKPGDRVTVTGIYRARPVRVMPRSRVVRSVFKGYIDAIHFQKSAQQRLSAENPLELPDSESFTPFNESDSTQDQLRAKDAEVRELAKDPDIYNKLVRSLAPSIFENEDVKRGLLVQLFGGCTKKTLNLSPPQSQAGQEEEKDDDEAAAAKAKEDGAVRFRGEINVLLCGDPGTSKSQLLQYVHKIAPRGVYTSGKGSSAVGLTAYITRDPETREMVLESGALVLSDRGVCCIDEFDKMSESARAILHEVMEQQTISIAKSGIICSLNARTSILAAANPRDSRYDPNMSVVDNILLPPTLLSRFDLIYLVLDKPHESSDRRLAQHLVSLYYLERDRPVQEDLIPIETLTRYISYSRRTVQPKISEAAGQKLVEVYLELRGQGRTNGHRKIITATPRQLESLIRMSEALARMKLSEVVTVEDVEEAHRLMKVATQSAAVDPKTGRINMDLLAVGQGMEGGRKDLEQQADAMWDLMTQLEMSRHVADREQYKHFLKDLREAFNRASSKRLNNEEFSKLFDFMESRDDVQIRNRDTSHFRGPHLIRLPREGEKQASSHRRGGAAVAA